jgi:pantetheine-phosphate adenylyltransferase
VARYPVAVLGGTFDRLHVGHAALLATAFRVGRTVAIGVTTAEYLARHPKPGGRAIQSYATRRRALARYLGTHYPRRAFRLVPLRDTFGRSVEDGVDALVVSADTVAGGDAVNAERRRRGRAPLPVVVVPLVLADDLEPVSSRRIRAGEIDPRGRRRAPIDVGLAAGDRDRAAAERALRAVFPRLRLTRLPESPTRQRLAPRSHARRAAAAAQQGRELGVGIVRSGRGRWLVGIRTSHVELSPRWVRGRLAPGLRRLLAPGPRR